MNERIVREAYDKGIRLIVTCDNGIAAFDAVTLAKTLGMTVVVTDHHDIPYEENEAGERRNLLIEADALVNPKQPTAGTLLKNCAAPESLLSLSKCFINGFMWTEHSWKI